MIKQLNINKMKNFSYKMMKHVTLIFVLCFLNFLMITSCGQMEQKEESTKSEKVIKTYKDYTTEEFEKLPHDVQYALKYPDDVDTIISIEYGWIDTLFTEDGLPSKINYVVRNANLVLEKDRMKFYYPYKSKPELHFFTKDKIFDKRKGNFTSYFEFDFKHNSSNDFYYIEKSDFPRGLFTETELEHNPSIERIFPTDNKYHMLVREIEEHYKSTYYTFSESHMNPIGYFWVCEENEVTKFKNWLQR